jgi:hypothetical protein
MSTPVGAVQAQNAQKGVKRSVQGNPVSVPMQLPGFRGRIVDAGGPIKAPKLRNGNLNNETSNVRVPYNRVCPLEMLSPYQGRLGPGDLIFNHKYAPGFLQSRATANNATLGVNTLSRVVGLDGLNRLLMGSSPNGWRLGENVYEAPDTKLEDGAYGVLGGSGGVFELSTLNEYRLDGVVISNDEPGAFTSSGRRDNAIFNIAIQGPTETNNGFLMYEDPTKATSKLYNPLTGVTNMRTVEAHARGSSESGMHIENTPLPGRVGSDFQNSRGKVDFVANFCGTYAMYPSQMFDRRVESMNTLHVGLRAYELSVEAKRQVTTATGERRFSDDDSEMVVQSTKMYFYQYLPFSSRVAHVIQAVTDKQLEMDRQKIALDNGVDAAAVSDAAVMAYMQRQKDQNATEADKSRQKAALKVGAIKQQTATSLPSANFDKAAYDPIRSEDLWNMVGAYQVGRVLDTKAAVHERYAGGPRDTAFSCIVDVNIAWRAAMAVQISPDTEPSLTGFLLDPSERTELGGQQSATTLANNISPPLTKTIGPDFGRDVAPGKPTEEFRTLRLREKQQLRDEREQLARIKAIAAANRNKVAAEIPDASKLVQSFVDKDDRYKLISMLVSESQYGRNPMDAIRQLVRDDMVTYEEPVQNSNEAWSAFMDLRNKCPPVEQRKNERIVSKYTSALAAAKSEWRMAANREVGALMSSADTLTTFATEAARKGALRDRNKELKKKIYKYVGALKALQAVATKEIQDAPDEIKGAAIANEVSKMLNRVNIFLVLLHQVLKEVGGGKRVQGVFDLKTCVADVAQASEDDALLYETVRLSEVCDMYEEHFPIDDTPLALAPAVETPAQPAPGAPGRRAAAPVGSPAAASAATPAPWPVPPAAAAAAADAGAAPAPARTGATAGAKALAKSRKSPLRPRQGAAATTGAPATAPAASPAPTGVPAGAAGVSATPLVPTQVGTAESAAPRRRAREAVGGSESVTNSLFENMFKPSATEDGAKDPASPTPSSGSEGPSGGPRTFRRQR